MRSPEKKDQHLKQKQQELKTKMQQFIDGSLPSSEIKEEKKQTPLNEY